MIKTICIILFFGAEAMATPPLPSAFREILIDQNGFPIDRFISQFESQFPGIAAPGLLEDKFDRDDSRDHHMFESKLSMQYE